MKRFQAGPENIFASNSVILGTDVSLPRLPRSLRPSTVSSFRFNRAKPADIGEYERSLIGDWLMGEAFAFDGFVSFGEELGETVPGRDRDREGVR
jgi:hypothetical protein